MEKVIHENKKRTLVKALIYRFWIIITTYIMLLVTGKDYDTAILPAVVINISGPLVIIYMTVFG